MMSADLWGRPCTHLCYRLDIQRGRLGGREAGGPTTGSRPTSRPYKERWASLYLQKRPCTSNFWDSDGMRSGHTPPEVSTEPD